MDLSIIIVSYNTKNDLKNCLKSIYKYTTGFKFEVIVVDNNSLDGSPDMVAKHFPKVKLTRSRENLGFGKANNLGASIAKGGYLLFLNSDTLIDDNVFEYVLTQVKGIADLGAYTCRLLYADGSIQPTGGYFPNLLRLLMWHTALDELSLIKKTVKPIHPDISFYNQSFEPDWITGAFMIVPRSLFLKVKGFDPNIFMYGEDLELCFRLKKQNKRIVYSDFPSLTHLQNKSSSSQFAIVSEIKGIKYFFKKHYPAWQLIFVDLIFKLGSLLRYVLFGIMLGNEAKKKAYREAIRA